MKVEGGEGQRDDEEGKEKADEKQEHTHSGCGVVWRVCGMRRCCVCGAVCCAVRVYAWGLPHGGASETGRAERQSRTHARTHARTLCVAPCLAVSLHSHTRQGHTSPHPPQTTQSVCVGWGGVGVGGRVFEVCLWCVPEGASVRRGGQRHTHPGKRTTQSEGVCVCVCGGGGGPHPLPPTPVTGTPQTPHTYLPHTKGQHRE